MQTQAFVKRILGVLFGLAFLIVVDKAAADTNIKIENSTGKNEVNVQSSQNSSVTSQSTSNVSNHVEVNGKTYVDDSTTSNGAYNSDINVNVQNNTGTVKYNVNGNEKTIQITPDESNTSENIVTPSVTPEVTKEVKKEENTSPKSAVKKDVFQSILKQLESLFTRLSSLISSFPKR
jgi:hypothetical protein